MVKKRNSETCKDNIPTFNSPGNSVEAKQHFLVGGRSVYLNTELTCELTYQPQKSLDSVHCREISATQTWLEAFSIKPITFSVHTQLTLIEMSENRDVLPLFESISKKDFEILEDNEGNQVQEPNHFSMEETIKNQSFLMMVVNSPDRLNNFIKQLQRLTYEELVETYSAWEQLDQSTDIIEFLQSIIAEIQTESSIRFVIKYLIKSKSLSEQLKWISSLGVVQNPTYQLINEMKDLLTNSLYNDTVYFVSLHMRRFCERNPSCIKYGVIKNMIDVIENSLNSSDLTKSLRSLEALSNIGPFLPTAKVISIIRKKLSDHENRLDYNFRILTAQIVYHFKCDENIDILLWTIISNASQSNELRIAVFNSYIRCLDDVKMENILLLLSRSLHNQIRSYIIKRIRRFDEDKGLLLGIQNSIYYESLQKTKYGYFLIESSLIYEAYSVMPIAFSAKIQYQTIDIMKDIIHVYYRCGSETIFQRAVIKLIKLIAFYIPSMKQYTERAEKEIFLFKHTTER
ncbi:unnamed protein product [Heterobilharzia americana]|nr:unnamed protein product [Heterobilharzia americana]